MSESKTTEWTPKILSVVMAYDAFRACLGGKPETFSIKQIILWLKLLEVS
jgi:hypothetical protein